MCSTICGGPNITSGKAVACFNQESASHEWSISFILKVQTQGQLLQGVPLSIFQWTLEFKEFTILYMMKKQQQIYWPL